MVNDYEQVREKVAKQIHDYCLDCKVKNQVAYEIEHCRNLTDAILVPSQVGVVASKQPEFEFHEPDGMVDLCLDAEEINALGWYKLVKKE